MKALLFAITLILTGCVQDADEQDGGLSATDAGSSIDRGPVIDTGVETDAQPSPLTCEPIALDDCFRSLGAADCGGDADEPQLYCTNDRCLWFTGGCPADGYDRYCDGVASLEDLWTTYCFAGSGFSSLGDEPWHRGRAMNVEIHEAEEAIEGVTPIVTCTTPGDGGVYDPFRICDAGELLEDGAHQYPVGVLRLWAGSESYLHSGYRLGLELDEANAVARACLVYGSDVWVEQDKEPVCATSGTIWRTETRARFELVFPGDVKMTGRAAL